MKTLIVVLVAGAVGLYAGLFMGATGLVYAHKVPEVRAFAYGFAEDFCYDDSDHTVQGWRESVACELAYVVVGEY